MTVNILISRQAEKDLQNIQKYIEEQYFSERAGTETVQNIINGLRELAIFPESGFDVEKRIGRSIPDTQNYRGVVLGNHIAFYNYDKTNNNLEIDRILNTQQNWITILK